MNRREINKLFEENIAYMRTVIPPDDIYAFAEATYMAALFFLRRYADSVDILSILASDPIAKKYTKNIMIYLKARERGLAIDLDLGLLEDEDD